MFNEFLIWIFQQILSDNPKNISADKLRNAFSKFCDNVENVVIAANSGLYSGNIEPSSSFPESTSKVFLVTTPGTYKNFGNVVLPENYFGFIFKTGSTFSLSKIEIPTPDMTAVNSAIDKMDDFIKNFKIDVDEEFDINSKNPISNKQVTKFVQNKKGEYSYVVQKPSSQTEITGFYRQVFPISENVRYKLIIWQSTAQNTAIAQYSDGTELYLSAKVSVAPTSYTTIEWTAPKSGSMILYVDKTKPDCSFSKYSQTDEGTGKYYVEWDEFWEEVKINEKIISVPTRNKKIDFDLPTTITNGPSNSRFYDVDNVVLPIGSYEIVIFQSLYFTASALKVNGIFERDIAIKVTSVSEKTNVDSNGYSHIYFEITKENSTIDLNIHADYKNAEIYSITGAYAKEKVFLTPKDLDSSLSDLSVISNLTKATIPAPRSIIRLDYTTLQNLPTAKGTVISGVLKYNDFQGNSFKKYSTLEVQGTSSAGYPKKNWKFELFNDEILKDNFDLSIGNLIEHSEFVFKADYIDITHSHNVGLNRLWEEMVNNRKGYPKRETEFSYDANNISVDETRFSTKALGHVEAFACVLYVNGVFYGIGNFGIGKKRNNYNLNKSNKNHIQLGDSVGQQNLYTFTPSQWELRNPKVSDYVEGGTISDTEVMEKITRLFDFNKSSQENITANIDSYYMRRNIIDYFIFTQVTYNFDGVSKNYLLTSWDGNRFAFMPYDLDSVFGMQFDGTSFFSPTANVYAHQNLNPNTLPFWNKIFTALKSDIVLRYKELKSSGILTVDNIYEILNEHENKFGLDLIKKDVEKWSNRPKLESLPRIMDYMTKRFVYLDNYFK